MALTDAQIQAALPYLGVNPQDFQAVRQMPTFEAATAALDELKKRAHRNFKKAARELHPDLTGGDEAKADIFRTCVEMLDQLDKLQLVRPQPRPVQWVTYTNSGTTATHTGFSSVTIRITVS